MCYERKNDYFFRTVGRGKNDYRAALASTLSGT
jgi:hypothetical protein